MVCCLQLVVYSNGNGLEVEYYDFDVLLLPALEDGVERYNFDLTFGLVGNIKK